MPEAPDSAGREAATASSPWAAALAVLEDRAARAAGPAGLEPWRPDAALPALPAELDERARAVQAAQQRAIDGLRGEQERIRVELESLGSAHAPRSDGEPPLYLDLIG